MEAICQVGGFARKGGMEIHEGARICTKETFFWDGGERMVGVGSGGRLGVADAVADAGDGDDVAGVAGVFIEFAYGVF